MIIAAMPFFIMINSKMYLLTQSCHATIPSYYYFYQKKLEPAREEFCQFGREGGEPTIAPNVITPMIPAPKPTPFGPTKMSTTISTIRPTTKQPSTGDSHRPTRKHRGYLQLVAAPNPARHL